LLLGRGKPEAVLVHALQPVHLWVDGYGTATTFPGSAWCAAPSTVSYVHFNSPYFFKRLITKIGQMTTIRASRLATSHISRSLITVLLSVLSLHPFLIHICTVCGQRTDLYTVQATRSRFYILPTASASSLYSQKRLQSTGGVLLTPNNKLTQATGYFHTFHTRTLRVQYCLSQRTRPYHLYFPTILFRNTPRNLLETDTGRTQTSWDSWLQGCHGSHITLYVQTRYYYAQEPVFELQEGLGRFYSYQV